MSAHFDQATSPVSNAEEYSSTLAICASHEHVYVLTVPYRCCWLAMRTSPDAYICWLNGTMGKALCVCLDTF